jgi:hypothetical protein
MKFSRVTGMKAPGLVASCLLGLLSAAPAPPAAGALVCIQAEFPENACLAALKRVHDEVLELGPYPGQDFVRWDFFIGGPDDDDTNKDQHVVVLIENAEGPRRMTLQVTQLERSRGDPRVKYARGTRHVICWLENEKLQVHRSDYGDKELEELASGILRAVLDKKRLLMK